MFSFLFTLILCRVSDLIDSIQSAWQPGLQQYAQELSTEGFRLRVELNNWEEYSRLLTVRRESDAAITTPPGSNDSGYDHSLLLSHTFFAAVSIYLSGIFDYEITYWQDWGLATPTLGEGQIQTHLNDILTLSGAILDTTALSPVLLLFPLRVAGARAREAWHQKFIYDLLGRVEHKFAVAGAFKDDLRELWDDRIIVSASTSTS